MRRLDLGYRLASPFAVFGAIALLEIGLIWRSTAPPMDIAAPPEPPAPLILSRQLKTAASPEAVQERVDVILARPLFTSGRNPSPDKPPEPAPSATPPRLTGLVIAPGERRAIFAGSDGHRAIVVGEGGAVGPFTVTSIKRGEVELAGPLGVQRLRLSSDVGLRSQSAQRASVIALIDPAQREAETESDQ